MVVCVLGANDVTRFQWILIRVRPCWRQHRVEDEFDELRMPFSFQVSANCDIEVVDSYPFVDLSECVRLHVRMQLFRYFFHQAKNTGYGVRHRCGRAS